MRLSINGEQVSYSLEHEQTLGEVVGGVQKWLAAAGFLVSELRADERDLLGTPPAEWSGTAVSSVNALDVRATHTGDLRIEHWRTVHSWLGMLAEELSQLTRQQAAAAPQAARSCQDADEAPKDVLQELLADLPQTLEGLKANPFLPRSSEIGSRFQALFGGNEPSAAPAGAPAAAAAPPTAAAVRAWPTERLQEAASTVAALRTACAQRIKDAISPRESLGRCAGKLRALLGRLPEVSVLLQTGQDKTAMDIVIGFADAVQSLMDLLPFLPPDPERARLLDSLTPPLRDLVSAFNSRDSVLIGDLLEYEIAPRMERITPLLEKAP